MGCKFAAEATEQEDDEGLMHKWGFGLLTIVLHCHFVVIGQIPDPLEIYSEKPQHQVEIGFERTDALQGVHASYDIQLAYATQRRPIYYHTILVTPVCTSGVCELVHVEVFWNLVGEYRSLALPQGHQLSKEGHQPFSADDYDKLGRILQDPYWPLAQFDIADLIVDSTQHLVDGAYDAYSGATADIVNAADNIEGALYTVYTLWTFVHDETIATFLKTHTKKLIAEGDIDLIDFLESSDAGHRRWALQSYRTELTCNSQYTDPLLRIVRRSDQFLAYKALQLLNKSDDQIVHALWEVFVEVPLDRKRDIMNFLNDARIDLDLLEKMIDYVSIAAGDAETYFLIRFLMDRRPLPNEVKEKILAIESWNNDRVKRSMALLVSD